MEDFPNLVSAAGLRGGGLRDVAQFDPNPRRPPLRPSARGDVVSGAVARFVELPKKPVVGRTLGSVGVAVPCLAPPAAVAALPQPGPRSRTSHNSTTSRQSVPPNAATHADFGVVRAMGGGRYESNGIEGRQPLLAKRKQKIAAQSCRLNWARCGVPRFLGTASGGTLASVCLHRPFKSDFMPPAPTVAIIGVGLIGGSIGAAALRRQAANRVIGIGRSKEKLEGALRLGAARGWEHGCITEYSLDFETCDQADLIVVCTPVDRVGR